MKKMSWRSLAILGVVAIGGLGLKAAPARAQGFGLSYASPGFGINVGNGGGFYGAPYYGYGYPAVVAPVVVPRPIIVPGPFYGARPYYGPRYYGGHYGGYRGGYEHHYRR